MPDVPPSLHSRYDPAKEATRYVEAQLFAFEPVCIFVSEPGESWLAPALRARYPGAKLVALRYHTELFSSSDSLWDAVWRPGTATGLGRFLFNLIPDEYLPLTVFLPWMPSDSVWPAESRTVWEEIASMIRLQQSVMHTRSHFGRRWLSNMIKNAVRLGSATRPVHTEKPVFLACAGPSLEKQLPLRCDTFYVCAVSSALSCLRASALNPDLCIATDGGYWALDHFRSVDKDVPVAFPLEAAVPSAVLESNAALVLTYGSALETKILALAEIVPERAERNGTVSGTAAVFALSHTANSVFAAGLDLCGSASFSHARPHVSDAVLSSAADRLHPGCGLLFARNLDTAPLDLYASWFASRDEAFKSRFFRLLPEGKPIEGIRSRSLASVSPSPKLRTDKAAPQRIPEPAVRGERISLWLGRLSSSLEPFADAASFAAGSRAFDEAILADPVCAEVLQLVSYTDYLRMLKKRHTSGGTEFAAAAAELCKKTIDFLARLRKLAVAGE